MPTINMLSSANMVKGQGVSSAYEEQVKLVREGLKQDYTVYVNSHKKCDIMHFHTINPNYYIQANMEKKRSASVGYVHFLPETVDDSLRLPKPARIILYRYIIEFYEKMDYLVTVNPYFIKELAKHGIDEKKVTYIPNFVADDFFYPYQDPQQVSEEKRKWGIPEDRFIVLGVGQVQPRKGVLDFIETARQNPDVFFVWAGGFSFGPMTDGYKELKEIMGHPPENVKFLGIIDREEMNGVYNAADVMFLPSFSELFPMTILEAMCCGKPILLRELDIYHDILFDYYLSAADIGGFSENIRRLSHDGDFYQQWSALSWKGHQYYCKNHVLELWQGFYDKVYEECVCQKLADRMG